MYATYFGLPESPFSITPDPRFLYLSAQHREALAHLLYGVQEGGGFVQLTGDVGTGKTTICRALLEQLPKEVDVALVLNPALTAHELLQTVCEELLIELPPDCDSTKVLIDKLNAYLLDANARGRRTVLIIDEAQNLSKEVLEQVRLLTNLETNRSKLLQIFLVGQPELGVLLDDRGLRQVAQRITARYHLGPLTKKDTTEYVLHRLAVAGGKRELFTDGALGRIYRYSRGVPRLINILSDRSLLGAYSGNKDRVNGGVVRRASRELSGRRPRKTPWLKTVPLAAGVTLVSLWAIWLGTSGRQPEAEPTPLGPSASGIIEYRSGDVGSSGVTPSSAFAPGGVGTNRQAAANALLARWGAPPLETQGIPLCQWAEMHGLRCLEGQGTWQQLQRYNRPALIKMRDRHEKPQFAVITELAPGSATLDSGEKRTRIALADLDQRWSRDYLILWRPPLPNLGLIGRGSSGPAVVWLRQALGRVEGYAAVDLTAAHYDDDLQAQIMRFQRARQILVDGVVGPETIIHVNTALKDPAIPLLWIPPTV